MKIKSLFLVLIACIFSLQLNAAMNQEWEMRNYKQTKINVNSPLGLFFDQQDMLWIVSTSGIISFDGNAYQFFNNYTDQSLKDGRFIKVLKNEIIGISNAHYGINSKSSKPYRLKSNREIFGNLTVNSKKEFFITVKQLKKTFGKSIIEKLLKLKTINYKVYFYPTTNNCAYYLFNNNIHFIRNGKIQTTIHGDFGEKDFLVFGDYLFHHKAHSFKVFHDGVKLSNEQVNALLGLEKKSTKNALFKTAHDTYVLLTNNCIYNLKVVHTKVVKSFIYSNEDLNNSISIDYNPRQNIYAISLDKKGICILKKKKINVSSITNKVNSISLFNDSLINIGDGILFNWGRNTMITSRANAKPNFTFLKPKRNPNCTWYQIDPTTIGLFNERNELLKSQKLTLTNSRYHGFLHTLIEDTHGNKWYHTDGDIFYEYLNESTDSKGFKKLKVSAIKNNETIETIAFINNHRLWIGTNKHLVEYNIKTGKSRVLLKNVDLRCITFDREGDCWLGTYGQGAYIFSKGKLIKLQTDADNNLLTCHCFLLDRSGHVWMSSDNGLFCIKKKNWIENQGGEKSKNSFVHFNTINGENLTEFNGGFSPCAFQHRGLFFYSSMDGLVYFNPQTITVDQTKPTIIISKIENDAKSIAPTSVIKLKNDFNYLSIKFMIPNWKIDNNISISYCISRNNQKPFWRYSKNEIYIPSLPSGSYNIQIKAENKLGKPLTTIKTIRIYVEKSFYESFSFVILLLLVLTVLIIIILRIRQSFLIKERNKLKKQVSNQIENLFEANNKLEFALLDLSQANNKLKTSDEMRAIMTSIFVHDLKAPMKFLTHISKLMFKKNVTLDQLEMIDLAQNIYITSVSSIQKIDQFLSWQANEQSSLKANLKEFSLIQVFEELEVVFSVFCKQNSNQFKIIGEQSIKVYSDLDLLKIIFWNLIDNSNKNTRKGEILLEIIDQGHNVLIRVKDNGKGIPQDELTKILQNIENNDVNKSNKNIGLKVVTSFIKLLNGKIEISSQGINAGTVVQISLPKTSK